jgi:acyl-CoA thioesterase II
MATLKDQSAIERIDTDCYQPIVPLIRMGALSNWAYGGNILAITVNAAYATIEKGQHLYSISGYFLRPASPSHKLICHVDHIRNTRNFQTRHLRVVQSDGKSEKPCLIATADFYMDEPADMVNYSGRPKLPIPSTPAEETATERTREPGLYRILDTMMAVHPHSSGWDGGRRFEHHFSRAVPLHRALQSEADRIAALAFYMDRGLAYIPANHSG